MASRAPAIIPLGDRDPVNRLYASPLPTVRRDWPVVEIRDARHLNWFPREPSADEIVTWVAAHTAQGSPPRGAKPWTLPAQPAIDPEGGIPAGGRGAAGGGPGPRLGGSTVVGAGAPGVKGN
jgi:hypothetical protein